ncbi:MAG: helix-turn-helix transcriptional regulator [Bacteroidales bacterium]|nr:helix-turn-helix transcriptional regulator [Bacteroidales bacterium]
MQTNNHQIKDYSAELDRKYGAVGTKEREQFDEEAWNFYTGQLLLELRKESKMTQEELAQRINSSKSYVSRIERGQIIPSVSVFYRIINALGLRVDIVRPLA